MKKIILILLTVTCYFNNCNNDKQLLTIDNIEVQEIKNKLLKVNFLLKNNSSIDYFVPFIKPASIYATFSYKDSSKWLRSGLDAGFLLTNKLLTRSDLFKSAELDSICHQPGSDTLIFYFELSWVKKYYDSILINYDNKNELRFIYPFIYNALGSDCIYIKRGEIKKITTYVFHEYPIEIKNLRITFDFNTDSISNYKEKYFYHIPLKIATYHLFFGRISSNK